MFLTKLSILLFLTGLLLSANALEKDSEESNDISVSPSPAVKLDATLRKALLRALAELENDEAAAKENQNQDENSVHRAQASTFTIYAKSNIQHSEIDAEVPNSSSEESTEVNFTENVTEEQPQEDETTDVLTTREEEVETTYETTTKDPEKPSFVIFQRSNSIQEPISIKSIEKDPQIDPLKDAELILTSASNNLQRDINKEENNKGILNKDANKIKTGRNLKVPNQNAIVDEDAKQKLIKNQETGRTTTLAPSTTTLETEAKVEQVQFFSAPLVAAFTVHQDEQGQPKKVEPIYRSEAAKQKSQESDLSPKQPSNPQADFKTLTQPDLIQRQKLLEEQLLRLKQQQTEQELFFQQQLIQQQSVNNQQNFAKLVNKAQGNLDPVFGEPTKAVLNQAISPIPVLNRFTSSEARFNPNENNNVGSSSIIVEPSITFDPKFEAEKLPLNAQILPIKEAKNFNTPFLNSLNFQPLPLVQKNNAFQPNGLLTVQNPISQNFQFNQQLPVAKTNTVFQPNPSLLQSNFQGNGFVQNQIPFQTTNFNANANSFNPGHFNIGQLPLQNTPRFNRQEVGTGNVLNNNNFNSNNNGFSIQQSTQPFLPTHEFSLLRTNGNPLLDGTRLLTPQNVQNNRFLPNNSQNTRFFRSNLEGTLKNQNQNFNQPSNRFFRSNQEGTVTSLNQNQRFVPPQFNRQLNNLLLNQGFGGRNTEDLNVVTKVLSLNFDQNNRVLRKVPPF